jgi:hypothetical protein
MDDFKKLGWQKGNVLTTNKTTMENNTPEQNTDNELIAEFMGARWDKDRGWRGSDGEIRQYLHNASSLFFHSDWNWLMPVVEKIAKIENDVYCDSQDFKSMSASSKVTMLLISNPISMVYKEVVDFIKWYNQQSNG